MLNFNMIRVGCAPATMGKVGTMLNFNMIICSVRSRGRGHNYTN